jgi:hypothetical protein
MVDYSKYMPTDKDIRDKHECVPVQSKPRNYHRPLNTGDDREMLRRYTQSTSIGYRPFAGLRLK